MSDERAHEQESRTSTKNELWEWIKAITFAVVLAVLIHTFLFAQFMVEGESMMPTLLNKERLIVNKIVYRIHDPRFDEIIVLQYPADPTKDFIKRIIGLPGDQIQVKDGKVYRNGKALNEPYIAQPTLGSFGPVTVPAETVFVMGDNRNNSKDSRDPLVGFVPYKNIVGRADIIFWPFAHFSIFPFQK